MSRKVTAALVALVNTINRLQPDRHRERTIGMLISALEPQGRVTVATKHGELLFLGNRGRYVADAAKGFHAGEPETLRWLDDCATPGSVLWDVGASIGLFATYAGKAGAAVYAFEPKATSYGVLTEHLALNGLGDQVKAFCVALSDRTGVAVLNLANLDPAGTMSALEGSTDSFGRTPSLFPQGALMARLDDLADLYGAPWPDHVKIDVDGVEGLILAGGPKVLAQAKSVLVEVEGVNEARSAEIILPPLLAAGLVEDTRFKTQGTGRNWLFKRPSAV